MGVLPLTGAEAALALLVVGAVTLALSLRALARRHRESRLGTLVAVDAGRPELLTSDRWRIRGRPDALRRAADGAVVPVEVKSRDAPRRGPARSHVVQVWAYCLLVEETTGRAPPFGVLRYADREFRVAWNGAARRELLGVRAEVDRPYDGRATPSVGRCTHCAWVRSCDARVLSG